MYVCMYECIYVCMYNIVTSLTRSNWCNCNPHKENGNKKGDYGVLNGFTLQRVSSGAFIKRSKVNDTGEVYRYKVNFGIDKMNSENRSFPPFSGVCQQKVNINKQSKQCYNCKPIMRRRQNTWEKKKNRLKYH